MFPFWDIALAPIIDAVRPKRVVEIGALRGETTVKVLDHLGPGVEFHVIDPLPAFDPAEHEQAFPGRYIFHRALSLDALPSMEPCEVALIDGDHNWYTVYNELKQLAQTARDAGADMPVMILHDVLWPYGRRDLYYNPDTVPEEFRQPYEQKGIHMDKPGLLNRGGLNFDHYNAVTEGGPRNGVMTGIDDFIEEYDRPLKMIVLPVYFGLAVIVEEERLAREPELAKVLAHLEGPDARLEMLEMIEDVRLRGALYAHNFTAKHQRAAVRYLDTLKAALLDEHYIENELRMGTMLNCIRNGTQPPLEQLRDPGRILQAKTKDALAARRNGRASDAPPDPNGIFPAYFPYTAMGRRRLDHIQECLDTIRSEAIPGDLVECGAGRGGAAVFMRAFLEIYEVGWRKVWVADDFRVDDIAHDPGMPQDIEAGGGEGLPNLRADLNQVRDAFERFDLFDNRTRFVQGDFAETLPEAPIEQIALLRIGPDQGQKAGDALTALYDRVSIGGTVIIDDYLHDPACRDSVDGFRAEAGVSDTIVRIDGSAVTWEKTAHAAPVADSKTRWQKLRERRIERGGTVAVGAPMVEPPTGKAKTLSVVVVFYNMKREAARTLHSLSRAYQQDLDGIDYEVIVVENGSSPDQKLDEAYVKGFGPEFQYLDMGDSAKPSPIFALNKGIAASSGSTIALMIDGAHVLTPGVLHYGVQASRQFAPSVVMTQQWYVGPGQQGDVMAAGYDQESEDELFKKIAWPTEGYRLFQIGHFIGERDWLDGMWESNCLFVPRKVMQQVGAFDESFVVPGGGFANLELFERLGATPGVKVSTILGEGSFHQVHGGTTTNQPEVDERRRRVASYGTEFAELRGKTFRGPGKQMHFIGTMRDEAARTRPRRMTSATLFQKGGFEGDPDAEPAKSEPIPEELRWSYTDAYWRSRQWRSTSWLGKTIEKSPTDLWAYQELIAKLRPDWIIEGPSFGGQKAHFLATICDLVGHGEVLSINTNDAVDRPVHDRLRYLTVESTFGEETRAAVDQVVGPQANALVILGSRSGKLRVVREFETYAHHVPVGGFVVVEETIMNGHPVYSSFGPGPYEAVAGILASHTEFVADEQPERMTLSFNPGGFLRRTS